MWTFFCFWLHSLIIPPLHLFLASTSLPMCARVQLRTRSRKVRRWCPDSENIKKDTATGKGECCSREGLGYKLHHLAVESDHDAAIVLRVVTPCGTLVPRNDLLPFFVLERCKDRKRVSVQCAFKSPWQHGPSGAKCDTFLWPMYHPLRQKQ